MSTRPSARASERWSRPWTTTWYWRRRLPGWLLVFAGFSCGWASELRSATPRAADFPELTAAVDPLGDFLAGNVIAVGKERPPTSRHRPAIPFRPSRGSWPSRSIATLSTPAGMPRRSWWQHSPRQRLEPPAVCPADPAPETERLRGGRFPPAAGRAGVGAVASRLPQSAGDRRSPIAFRRWRPATGVRNPLAGRPDAPGVGRRGREGSARWCLRSRAASRCGRRPAVARVPITQGK